MPYKRSGWSENARRVMARGREGRVRAFAGVMDGHLQAPACILALLSVTGTFAPRPGARIAGRYELKRHLRGTGAVQVFQAHDHQARGECALMLFDPDRCQPGAWAAFVRIVAAGAEAQAPGLAALGELSATPSNAPYCVTELPSGRGLDEVRREDGRQDWKRALSLGVWFAEILDNVHRATRVAHRALTPARCVVGAGDVVTVLDYGVAELEGASGSSEDAGYRAPEQQRGGGDARSDVYSLAAILFELITGERPSPRMPPLLRSIVRDAPKEVEDLFTRALAREPGRRFADLAALSSVMQRWCGARPRALAGSPNAMRGPATVSAPTSAQSPRPGPAPAVLSGPASEVVPVSELAEVRGSAGREVGRVQITPAPEAVIRRVPNEGEIASLQALARGLAPEVATGETTERLPSRSSREPSPAVVHTEVFTRPPRAAVRAAELDRPIDQEDFKTTTFVRPPRSVAPIEHTEKLPRRGSGGDSPSEGAARPVSPEPARLRAEVRPAAPEERTEVLPQRGRGGAPRVYDETLELPERPGRTPMAPTAAEYPAPSEGRASPTRRDERWSLKQAFIVVNLVLGVLALLGLIALLVR